MATEVGEAQTPRNVEANPFTRSSRLGQSTDKQTPTNATSNIVPPIVDLVETDNLGKLKEYIDELQAFVKDKHNVHKDIKRLVILIKRTWVKLSEEQPTPIVLLKEKNSQTEYVPRVPHLQKPERTPKRRLDKTKKPSGKSPKAKKNRIEHEGATINEELPTATPATANAWTTVTNL